MSYPLSDGDRARVFTAGGTPVADVSLERVLSGEVTSADLQVAPDTLRLQADFAEEGGNPQLAANLRRGAELIAFDDDALLRFYDALRPGRSTAAELDALAEALAVRGATACAALVREARAAYVRRGLVE